MKKILSIILCMVITVSLFFCVSTVALAIEPGPAIKEQPQDVVLNYPDRAEFTVVPQNPDEVASYQWYFVDSMGQMFKLDGKSAKTDKLVCPALDKYYDGRLFFCVLTGKNGSITESAPAYITVLNASENVKAFYIGNYAIKCGESLDLSNTELGSGVISFAADGKSITLNNVNMDNTDMILDHVISTSIGIYLDDYGTNIDRFYVNLIGNNTIKNTFYQESTNSGGITFDLTFMGLHGAKAPDVHIVGSGSLTLIGGAKQLNTNGDLYIEAPINFNANGDYFCDAVNANNVIVCEDVKLNFNVNGTLLYAKGGIDIKSGAVIKAKTTAPFVMNDYTNKNGFLCTYDVNITNASVEIELAADPARFTPFYNGIANFIGINNRGKLSLKESTVKITQTALKGESEYFYNGGGIICTELELDRSTLEINVNSDEIIDSYGISTKNNITVNDSIINCYEHTSGRVFGIAASGGLKIKGKSTVISDCASNDDEAFGIMYKTADIDLTAPKSKVESKVTKGFAMGANIGSGKDILAFDEDYKTTASNLGEHTVFVTPEDAVFNHASMKKSSSTSSYIYIETPYSAATKSAATHVVIGCDIPEPQPEPESESESEYQVSPATGDNLVLPILSLLLSAALLVFAFYRKKTV